MPDDRAEDPRRPGTGDAAPPTGGPAEAASVDAVEVVDAEALAGTGARHAAVGVQPTRAATLARAGAAVAGTGFVAGVAAAVLVARHTGGLRGGLFGGPRVVGSHRFLVDVHLLGR